MITQKVSIDILAFDAHPDDVECVASGVLLKQKAKGKTVAFVDLTAGEMGSYGTVVQRKKEAATAAMLMVYNEENN